MSGDVEDGLPRICWEGSAAQTRQPAATAGSLFYYYDWGRVRSEKKIEIRTEKGRSEAQMVCAVR